MTDFQTYLLVAYGSLFIISFVGFIIDYKRWH
jgi:hypothetical protein